MSKGIRLGILILAVLVLVSAAVAISVLMQKKTLQDQNQKLHAQIADAQNKAADLEAKIKKLQDDAQALNTQISQTQQEKAQVQSLYDELKTKSRDLQSQLDQANTDRDDWKSRAGNVTRERDDLMEKLKDRPTIEKIVYKDRIVKVSVPEPEEAAAAPVDLTTAGGNQDLAEVLKAKAALQVQLQQAKADLDQAALQVAGLKKQNSDLDLQVKQLSNEREEIAQKLKYGNELADNLSVELAHSHDYQNSVNGRADKVKEENLQLAAQIRDLTATKLALEQTISRLMQEKDTNQKKLAETQSTISAHIKEVSRIQSSVATMELPPIIINAPNQAVTPSAAGAGVPSSASSMAAIKKQGSIISINKDSNFIIADLGGANSSVTVGSVLKAYRGGEEIGTFEVIQVRRDICAADIKTQSTDLHVGDVVELI